MVAKRARLHRVLTAAVAILIIGGVSRVATARPIVPTTIVIDNNGSGFTRTPVAAWTPSTSGTGYYSTDFLLDPTLTSDVGLAAKWTPTIFVSGQYKIYMRWPERSNQPSVVPLEIAYEGGAKVDSSRRVNQTINGGSWVFVGTYYLAAGSANYVKISGTGVGQTAADAVRFELSFATTDAPTSAPLSLQQSYSPGSQVVIVMDDAGAFGLTVDGNPFFVKGVCNANRLADMHDAGSNAARTYSTNQLGDSENPIAFLDEAASLGMKIVIGLWLRQETTSFTYFDDPDIVAAQLEDLKVAIDEYKDHPALLAWGVGNEVDPTDSAHPEEIYSAMNDVARYVHEVDPFHPTISVHAGSHVSKMQGVMELAPDIDIVAFNTYAHIGNVRSNVEAANWSGPYAITEFAINQPAEALDTNWPSVTASEQVPLEPNSADKYATYKGRYLDHILTNTDKCIGSFAFATSGTYRISHTWYNLLLDDEFNRAPAFDAMHFAWTGADPPNLAPKIVYLSLAGADSNVVLSAPGAPRALMAVTDGQGEALTYSYEVREERPFTSSTPPPPLPINFTVDSNDPRAAFFASGILSAGKYRLFAYVRDASGRVGTANIPFLVEFQGTGAPANEAAGTFAQLNEPSPNPFQGLTTISYQLPTTGAVKVRVFDVRGRLVRILADAIDHDAGEHIVVWDGRGEDRIPMASGVYFVTMEAGGLVETRKVVLSR